MRLWLGSQPRSLRAWRNNDQGCLYSKDSPVRFVAGNFTPASIAVVNSQSAFPWLWLMFCFSGFGIRPRYTGRHEGIINSAIIRSLTVKIISIQAIIVGRSDCYTPVYPPEPFSNHLCLILYNFSQIKSILFEAILGPYYLFPKPISGTIRAYWRKAER